MNRLYFGDNLEILREMDDERVHLICTDPPFNSGRDYNAFIGDSLNKGDIVLDPCCGCGTTIDAAQTLNRQWMGIDITILALDPMRQRLADRHGLQPSVDYQIEGYPTNMQEVRRLLIAILL